jgi:heat shock protein 1/8
MVLIRLKEATEKYLKTPVKRAVITVPAYFRDGQRQATRDAASIAGLNVLRLVNEPSASAIAYGMSKHFPHGEVKVLVYEFGAGTFDASVISIEDGFIQIMSTVGDTHLGAEDFDNKLLEVCIEQFKKNTNIELINEWMAIQKLKKKCSRVRKVLSSEKEASILVENLVPGQNFEMKVTRAEWEKIGESILQKTVTLTNKALEDARISAKK